MDTDDRSGSASWRDLSDLTSKERASYDACVQKALAGQGAAQPSASPTPSGTATPAPSQTPSEQQAPAETPADAG